jgi:hypothetical protein
MGKNCPSAGQHDRVTLSDGGIDRAVTQVPREGRVAMLSQEGTVAHATIAKALALKCEGGLGGIQGKWTCFPCMVHSNSQLI